MRINEDILRFMTVKVEELEEGPSAMMQKRDRDDPRRPRRPRFGGGRASAAASAASATVRTVVIVARARPSAP